jgi:hypothetical protein
VNDVVFIKSESLPWGGVFTPHFTLFLYRLFLVELLIIIYNAYLEVAYVMG